MGKYLMMTAARRGRFDKRLKFCLTGRDTESGEEAEASARAMLDKGVESVLVKRGINGSMLVSRSDKPLNQSIFSVEKVREHCQFGAQP